MNHRIFFQTFVIISTVFSSTQLSAQSSKWSVTLDSANIFSSPRFTDLNKDGTKDVVIGAGLENTPVQQGVVAIDGANGEILWTVAAKTQIYTSALFQDINGDQVDDVFIGGRAASFFAIDGASGEIIWEFWPTSKGESRTAGFLNFFSTQWVDDQNNDGYRDLLVTNGGDYLKAANDKNRASARLMILSGLNGEILSSAWLPEDRESYYAPHTHNNNEEPTIVFGTGGETIDGALWEVPMKQLMKGNIKKADLIVRDSVKGFILNSVMADLNGDGKLDLINARMNATIAAYDGISHQELWSQSFKGYECYVTPTLGQFVNDNTPDLFTILAKGSFPNYVAFKLVIIDGKTGELAWQEDSGFNQFSPAVAADLNNDDTDEIIYIENTLLDPKSFLIVNQVKVLDIRNGQNYYIGSIRTGLSMASSPGLTDLDNDGNLEIVVATSSIPMGGNNQYSKIECIELNRSIDQITWPGYLGIDGNGILFGD